MMNPLDGFLVEQESRPLGSMAVTTVLALAVLLLCVSIG